MQSIIQRFITFDRLIGPSLVKILYFSGALLVLVLVGVTMCVGLLAIAGGNFGSGLVQLAAAPAVGAVALVYWRFLCELFMLAFLTYERLGDVRDRLGPPPAPDPNHPQF